MEDVNVSLRYRKQVHILPHGRLRLRERRLLRELGVEIQAAVLDDLLPGQAAACDRRGAGAGEKEGIVEERSEAPRRDGPHARNRLLQREYGLAVLGKRGGTEEHGAVASVVCLHDAERAADAAVAADRRRPAAYGGIAEIGHVCRIVQPAHPIEIRAVGIAGEHHAVIGADAVGRDDRTLVDALGIALHRVGELHNQPVGRARVRRGRGGRKRDRPRRAVQRKSRDLLAPDPRAHRAGCVDLAVQRERHALSVGLESVFPVRREQVDRLVGDTAAGRAARDRCCGDIRPRSGYALCLRPIIRVKAAAGDDPELPGKENRPALMAGQTGEQLRWRPVVRPDIELCSGMRKALHRTAEVRAEEPVYRVSQVLYRPPAEPLLRHTAAVRHDVRTQRAPAALHKRRVGRKVCAAKGGVLCAGDPRAAFLSHALTSGTGFASRAGSRPAAPL